MANNRLVKTLGDGAAPKPRVQSVARASSILFSIAASENGLTVSEIRKRTELPQQATYHLLHTLTEVGLVRRGGQGTYVLGLRVGSLIDGYKRSISYSEELQKIVRRVAQNTGETSYVSGWVDADIVTIAVELGSNVVHASGDGKYLGGLMHARAAGKLLIAMSDEQVRRDFFAENSLEPLTDNTLTTEGELRDEFEDILKLGYALDREEYTIGLSCLAVPLRFSGGIYALCVSGPTERIKENLHTVLDQLNDEVLKYN